SFFFFQAEDGIRDRNVTGVQTCALPISHAGELEILRLVSSRNPVSSVSRLPAWSAFSVCRGGPGDLWKEHHGEARQGSRSRGEQTAVWERRRCVAGRVPRSHLRASAVAA